MCARANWLDVDSTLMSDPTPPWRHNIFTQKEAGDVMNYSLPRAYYSSAKKYANSVD